MSLVRRGLSVYREHGFVSLIKKTSLFVSDCIFNQSSHGGYPTELSELEKLSDPELFGIVRHEAHRIEKAVYNKKLDEKKEYYDSKRERINNVMQILIDRGYSADDNTLSWAREIIEVNNNNIKYIKNNIKEPKEDDLSKLDDFVDFVSSRRSVRVWKNDQPDEDVLIGIAHKMIEAAKWAPHSGNRQSWRFYLMTTEFEKEPLGVIKEEHTMAAPLLIFVGMDRRLYGDVADSETGIYIDAGAGVMQMVLAAQRAGVGTCWNHFGRDLINSREKNKEAYSKFTDRNNIPEYIEPIAIIAVGLPEYIPPTPPRAEREKLMI